METNFKNNLAPAVIELNRMNEELQAENERLKAELKKWEDRSKVVKDGYDGEVYEWEGNYYIVTPYLNVFVKGLLKENAKLKCLALHGMVGYATCKMNLAAEKYKDDEMSAFAVPLEFSKWHRKEIEWTKAYRKAKQALREEK